MPFHEALLANISQHIDNHLGLYAFLALIPLILIYLIRPRPRDKTIPSLMFFLKELNKMKRYRYLKYFLREMLFLFHLLLLLLLATAITQPFVLTKEDVTAEYTVLVLDVSASMQAQQGLTGLSSRFDKMLSIANKYLEGKISIILAANEPLIVLENGDYSDAKEVLSKLKPKTTLSSIGKSLLAAGDLLKEKKGKVVAISDFVNTDEVDPYVAKKTLEAKDQMVIFEEVRDEVKNVGIVGAKYSDEQTLLEIQNYNDEPAKVILLLNNQKQTEITIAPNWIETVPVKNLPGLNTVKLDVNDDFNLDNTITLSVPVKHPVKILVVTNQQANYIQYALQSYKEIWNSEAKFEVANPPVMPVVNHDIMIINGVENDKLPRATLDKMQELVEEGATLIITAQPDLPDTNLERYLPVKLMGKGGESAVFNTRKLLVVTEDITFDKVKSYFKAEAKEDALVLAKAEDESPIITLESVGKGKIIYLGILDAESNFKFSVSYPLFWQQLIDYVIGLPNINTLNRKIGEKVVFEGSQEITTPTAKTKAEEFMFDEVGVYTIGPNKVAVNLLNKLESNINFEEEGIADKNYDKSKFNVQTKKSITEFMVYAILVLLFLELLYIKIRGDL